MRIQGFGSRENGYQGSSFSEMLAADYPHLMLDFSGGGSLEHLQVPHGTTVLAFKYADGVIVAGDRLATEGMRVASRDVQKVYATDAYSIASRVAAASPE